MKKFTVVDVIKSKNENRPVTMVTAYDKLTAELADQSGADMILVGDSLGMVVLGYDDTINVTMEDMISHSAAVKRCSTRPMIVCDMPFMSYQVSPEDAVRNAGRLMKEGHCDCVKLEGGVDYKEHIRKIVNAGIPVCGHIGYTPQSINVFGGHHSQGRNIETAEKVLKDALAVQEAGAFAVVLECIPYEVAAYVTSKLDILTIGIGSGSDCGGQVLVIHDLLGLGGDFRPKHAKRFVEGGQLLLEATTQYVTEVQTRVFPTVDNSFKTDAGVIDALKEKYDGGVQ